MGLNINRESYNKIAEEWSESRSKSFLSELVIDFSSKIKPKGKVLDIGCGTGYPIANYLSEQGFIVTGIDISEKLLQKAIDQDLSNTNFFLCDFFDFEPMEKYDGVIAFDSFFHFLKKEQRMIYEKVSGWMNPGAYLLFTHFTHGNEDEEIRAEMFGEIFCYSSLSKDSIQLLLSDAGLKIVWLKENYTEKDMDRDLVMLCRKTQMTQL